MPKNKKLRKSEEFILKIEVSDTNSELIMRLDSMLKKDITSQKLPTDFNNIEKSKDAE